MKEVFLLSGLGADRRVFDFLDLSNYKVTHVNWNAPLENEKIENYANRLLPQITGDRPILIGVSFGGIICVELGKLIETEKIILISSVKTKFELPLYFRIAGKLRFHKLIPGRLLKNVNALTYWFFGVEEVKHKKLLKSIINDTDVLFLKWAINCIVSWKNTITSEKAVHIHGTTDKILPAKKPDISISNGGHLMIITKGVELSAIINRILL